MDLPKGQFAIAPSTFWKTLSDTIPVRVGFEDVRVDTGKISVSISCCALSEADSVSCSRNVDNEKIRIKEQESRFIRSGFGKKASYFLSRLFSIKWQVRVLPSTIPCLKHRSSTIWCIVTKCYFSCNYLSMCAMIERIENTHR